MLHWPRLHPSKYLETDGTYDGEFLHPHPPKIQREWCLPQMMEEGGHYTYFMKANWGLSCTCWLRGLNTVPNKVTERVPKNALPRNLFSGNISDPSENGLPSCLPCTFDKPAALDSVAKGYDGGQVRYAFFISVAKAFHRALHLMLLQRSQTYGVIGPPIEISSSFLTDRAFVVEAGSTSWKPVPVSG